MITNPCSTVAREIEISNIWTRLVHRSKSPFPIMDEEVLLLTKNIETLLDKGWTPWEITQYIGWTEYFNTVDTEEVCLRKMSEMLEFVNKRLNATRSDLF